MRPEKRKELTQTLHSIVKQVRKENGCLHTGFYQNFDDENGFAVVEEWATENDSDAHLRSDLFRVLLGAGSLMRKPPEIVIHTVERSTELKV